MNCIYYICNIYILKKINMCNYFEIIPTPPSYCMRYVSDLFERKYFVISHLNACFIKGTVGSPLTPPFKYGQGVRGDSMSPTSHRIGASRH